MRFPFFLGVTLFLLFFLFGLVFSQASDQNSEGSLKPSLSSSDSILFSSDDGLIQESSTSSDEYSTSTVPQGASSESSEVWEMTLSGIKVGGVTYRQNSYSDFVFSDAGPFQKSEFYTRYFTVRLNFWRILIDIFLFFGLVGYFVVLYFYFARVFDDTMKALGNVYQMHPEERIYKVTLDRNQEKTLETYYFIPKPKKDLKVNEKVPDKKAIQAILASIHTEHVEEMLGTFLEFSVDSDSHTKFKEECQAAQSGKSIQYESPESPLNFLTVLGQRLAVEEDSKFFPYFEIELREIDPSGDVYFGFGNFDDEETINRCPFLFKKALMLAINKGEVYQSGKHCCKFKSLIQSIAIPIRPEKKEDPKKKEDQDQEKRKEEPNLSLEFSIDRLDRYGTTFGIFS